MKLTIQIISDFIIIFEHYFYITLVNDIESIKYLSCQVQDSYLFGAMEIQEKTLPLNTFLYRLSDQLLLLVHQAYGHEARFSHSPFHPGVLFYGKG